MSHTFEEKFDFIGDAVWSLAWRLYDQKKMSAIGLRCSGRSMTYRAQIAVRNDTMTVIARRENIKPLGDSPKAHANGLEHYIGKLEHGQSGLGLKTAIEIIDRNLNWQNIYTSIDHINQTTRHGKLNKLKLEKRYFKRTLTQLL